MLFFRDPSIMKQFREVKNKDKKVCKANANKRIAD